MTHPVVTATLDRSAPSPAIDEYAALSYTHLADLYKRLTEEGGRGVWADLDALATRLNNLTSAMCKKERDILLSVFIPGSNGQIRDDCSALEAVTAWQFAQEYLTWHFDNKEFSERECGRSGREIQWMSCLSVADAIAYNNTIERCVPEMQEAELEWSRLFNTYELYRESRRRPSLMRCDNDPEVLDEWGRRMQAERAEELARAPTPPCTFPGLFLDPRTRTPTPVYDREETVPYVSEDDDAH